MLVIKPDTKKCMAELLLKETFDAFLFIEGDITTFNKFHIDGYLQKKFFAADETEGLTDNEYSNWHDIRDFCFSIIKGRHTPLDFKLVLSLKKNAIKALIDRAELPVPADQVQGLYLNFRYNGETLQCITGISLNTFIPDKTLEHEWDKYVHNIFEQMSIPYEIIS